MLLDKLVLPCGICSAFSSLNVATGHLQCLVKAYIGTGTLMQASNVKIGYGRKLSGPRAIMVSTLCSR